MKSNEIGPTVGEVIAGLPARQRLAIEKRATELIAQEMSLRDLRRSLELTQVQVAQALDKGQHEISRIEQRDDNKAISPSDSQQCEKLTFTKPVKLLNHPHIVTALIMGLRTDYGHVDLDGVAYTLQPTQAGDEVPTVPSSYDLAAPSWFGVK